MIIIPAIDIIKGRVVRLRQGDFSQEKSYSDDPLSVAKAWEKDGARFLHLVDLDGARLGRTENKEIIANIIRSVKMPCEVGGGLRTEEDVEYFLEQGASRVIFGTKAFEDIAYFEKLVSRFKEKIVVSIDFVGGHVVSKGWQEETELLPEDAAKQMVDIGVKTLVVTDIATDGTLEGPNTEKLKKIFSAIDASIIISGGISSLKDIKKIKNMGLKNIEGIIIGRAFYEKKFSLKEANKITG